MVTKAQIFVISVAIALLVIVADSYAKGSSFSGSRSFSTSRSTSFSTYKPSSTPKSTPTPSAVKTTSDPKPMFSSGKPAASTTPSNNPKPVFDSGKPASTTLAPISPTKPTYVPKVSATTQPTTLASRASDQNKLATSKAAYIQQQNASYKPRPIATTSHYSRPTYTSPAVTRVTVYDHRTYYNRRSNYYGGWNQPVYVHQSYSSFGMWDSIALWYMLDHINDRHYRDLYYNQQNDQGMREWRQEADRLAQDNAELKAKLNALDSEVQKQQAAGVKVDPNYVPQDVDTDILLSQDAIAAALPKMRLCSGRLGNAYSNYSNSLASGVSSVEITSINTAGSSQNLTKLDNNECDGAVVQRDVYLTHTNSNFDYERIASPYSEVLNLVCNKSAGIDNFSDLTEKITVDIGEKNSGSQSTWNVIVLANPKLAKINTQQIGGVMAANNLQMKRVDCMFTVAGRSSKIMSTLSQLSNNNFNLVDWNTTSLDKLVDPAGHPIYNHQVLNAGTYLNGMQVDSWVGWFNTSTNVITVPADLIVANSWKKQNLKQYDDIVNDINTNSISAIQANAL